MENENRLVRFVPYGPREIHEGMIVDELKVTVKHYEKLIKVDVTPVMRDKRYGGYSVCYSGKIADQGFCIGVLPCPRKSTKKMEKIADKVLPMAEKFAEMFAEGKYQEIVKEIQDAVDASGVK